MRKREVKVFCAGDSFRAGDHVDVGGRTMVVTEICRDIPFLRARPLTLWDRFCAVAKAWWLR